MKYDKLLVSYFKLVQRIYKRTCLPKS